MVLARKVVCALLRASRVALANAPLCTSPEWLPCACVYDRTAENPKAAPRCLQWKKCHAGPVEDLAFAPPRRNARPSAPDGIHSVIIVILRHYSALRQHPRQSTPFCLLDFSLCGLQYGLPGPITFSSRFKLSSQPSLADYGSTPANSDQHSPVPFHSTSQP